MKNSGFTLLETIIYCALFSVLMTSALLTVYSLMNTTTVIKNQTALIAESAFINQKLTWIFMNATDLEIIDVNKVKIIRPDLHADSPLQIEFFDNNIFLTRGLSASTFLVSPRIQVSLQSISYEDSNLSIVYSLNSAMFQFSTYVP